MDRDVLTDLASGKQYPLKPLGEARGPNPNPMPARSCMPAGRAAVGVIRLTVDLPWGARPRAARRAADGS
jgi:hypothetical protein